MKNIRSIVIGFLLLSALLFFVYAKPNHPGKTGRPVARVSFLDVARIPLRYVIRSSGAIYDLVTFQNRYEKKIALLEKKVALLKKAAVAVHEVTEENERLRSLLFFKKRFTGRSIAAEIIGRSYSGFESFIIIDRGQADGITAAMSLAKDEGLLGRVFEVGRNASKVMLIDDPNSRVSVAIQRTREQGTLIGMGAGLCKIMYLSPASDVQPGDIVISSGLGALDPKGVIVGEVEKVIREPRALDTSALVRPSCDLFKIEEALCIE